MDASVVSTDHDFILSSEVGWLAQQLALGHSDGAGSLPYQNSVVEPHPSWCWGDQVSTLWAHRGRRQGAKLGGKLTHKRKWPHEEQQFPQPTITSVPPKYVEN